MSQSFDWQAANAPMLAALQHFHGAHKVTGEISHESVTAFYATLQNAYFLIPNAAADADAQSQTFALELELHEGGLLLSVFSSVAQARLFFGDEHKLNRVVQAAPDFFAALTNIVESLAQNDQSLRGVALDRSGGAGYFFEPAELEVLAASSANLAAIRIE